MLEDHAKVVQFMSLAGEVTGRKKLQKMIFIAKKLDFSFQEKYKFHMYGPYSDELTVRIEELCNLGFLEEKMENKGSYSQYCYRATAKGEEFTSIIEEASLALQKTIILMNQQNSRFLELVATLLFFDNLTQKQRIEKVKTVKASLKLTDDELQNAFLFIDNLQQF
ncbi:YwgA family protein [Kurthia sibirica]|uniref:YwgA family protein n=1 Tax=Kurthia sibirica TaxID=202750 RepID=A0A2U3AHB6_9BACL|nr:hypothetical protein [Kurthia sibirica]PWI23884.1 hypothetical protein DEX24_15565 [Kurthia sibirica]GEK35041.1 hypothetical protein KSI01_25740 [Kurthia sibirica]